VSDAQTIKKLKYVSLMKTEKLIPLLQRYNNSGSAALTMKSRDKISASRRKSELIFRTLRNIQAH